jgi:NAD(P)-dependent dehydrogenase (short-subunit alcohol dehydrogenase family)
MSANSTFKDKVTIITGGASGIGRAVGLELARRGAVLVLSDVNIDGAEEVASAIRDSGGKATAEHLDVTDPEKVQKLVEETAAEHGRLDYIFNNAGIAVAGEVRDMSLEDWRRIVDINLWGVIHGTMAAYPLMIGQGFGHIVNVASVAGLVGIPTLASYSTTKHAVVGLSTSLRHEAAGLGVKVSVVCPGFIKTGIFDAATVLNMDREETLAKADPVSMDVENAALKIVRGVEKNKMIINFVLHARIAWWLHRLLPSSLSPIMAAVVKDVRKMRIEA